MSAYFITGTGTDIGKTWLSCALLRLWREQGRKVRAYKPVQSGFDPVSPAASDAGALLQALGRTVDEAGIAAIAPWRFAAPLSPDMAAAREGKSIDFAALIAFTSRATGAEFGADDAPLLIEGVGGVMVPLDARHTVRDWIAAVALPSILVTGSYLGSLSHTLTSLAALREVGAGVTAIAVNESADSGVTLAEAVDSLRRHASGIPIVAIARANPAPGLEELAALL